MLHVDQKVVCVSLPPDLESIEQRPWEFPKIGHFYSVRTVFRWPNDRGASCRLWEIRNEPIEGFEPAFDVEFFRPIVERKTDTGMAILERIRREVTNKELRPIIADQFCGND